MKDSAQLATPPFPPSNTLFSLFALNILSSFVMPNLIIFRFFAYYYGFMMLFVNGQKLISKVAIFLNFVSVIFCISGLQISYMHQLITCVLVCLIHYRYLINGIKQAVNALIIQYPTFQTVFFVIQLGIITQFFAYFTDFKQIRIIPNLIRIAFNIRVWSFRSFIGVIRFSLKSVLIFTPSSSQTWVYLNILLSIWQTAVDFYIQFRVQRIFGKSNNTCFYPKPIILWIFLLDSFLQWTWYFGGPYVGSLMIIKKVAWNHVKLEARDAQRPVQSLVSYILMKTIKKKEIGQVCM